MSFMQVIDKFDEVSKHPCVSNEIKEYADAMKKIFIGIEKANVGFEKLFEVVLGKETKLN